MFRSAVGVLVVFAVLAVPAMAVAEDVSAVVVSYDKDKNKLTVKVGEKEQAYDLPDKVHVHDTDGKEIKPADRADKLKKGVKVELELKDGKVVEVNIKK